MKTTTQWKLQAVCDYIGNIADSYEALILLLFQRQFWANL